MAATDETHHLRILIANEKRERLERLAAFIATLGHEVIAREIHVKEVAASTAREHPDVALVGLGSSTEHALDLISEIVREAACPVIAILERRDPAYVNEAATRGVFAYIVADGGDPEELQSALDITLRRFAEYQNLQGAFGRRARIEQAKGILMARHAIDEQSAFELLRDHSQRNGRKLVEVATPSSSLTFCSSRRLRGRAINRSELLTSCSPAAPVSSVTRAPAASEPTSLVPVGAVEPAGARAPLASPARRARSSPARG